MRVVVCGAGLAGLSLAVVLGRAGCSVLLLEKAPGLRDHGYMLDFVGSGYDAAERMELLSDLKCVQYHLSGVRWLTARGHYRSRLDYRLFRRLHNNRFLNVMRGDLERILFEALPNDVEVRFASSIAEVRQSASEVVATLTSGQSENADLLVGADGVHSHVRALVFGADEQFSRYLGFHTASYVYEDPHASEALGHEIQIVSVPGRQAGLYPLRDGKVASFFVHKSSDASPPPSPVEALQRTYGDLGWRVPQIIDAGSAVCELYYDQLAQIEITGWRRGRVALIGDACQAVTLLAGQGASMAVGGAYVLASALTSGRSIDDALAEYERRIAPAIASKQAAGRRAANFVVPPSMLRLCARDVGVTLARLPGAASLLHRQLVEGTESVL